MKHLPVILIMMGLIVGLLGFTIGGGIGHGTEGVVNRLRHTANGMASLTDEQLRVVWPEWDGRDGERLSAVSGRLFVPWVQSLGRSAAGTLMVGGPGLGLLLILLGVAHAVAGREARQEPVA